MKADFTRSSRLVAVAATAVTVAIGCGTAEPEPASVPADSPAENSPTPTESAELPGSGFHQLTLDSGGRQREYLLDAPTGYDPAEPTPLIVVLHAGRSGADTIRAASGMAEFAEQHDVLVAYPRGVGGWWRPEVHGEHGVAVEWGGDPTDVEFLRDLVAHLVGAWNVAPGSVFATGHSNGAAMTYRLAVEASDVFAAVAPVGGYIFDPPDAIEPEHPVSVVGFVGRNSRYTDEIAQGMNIWRDLLDCEPEEPEAVGGDDRVTRTAAHCANGSEVVQYDLESMGHRWPEERLDGLDANEAMWEFFIDHARSP